jgi:hypothetical protein
MLESSSFNKLLSGVRECNRMLHAAARNGSRQFGATLKVILPVPEPQTPEHACAASSLCCMAAAATAQQSPAEPPAYVAWRQQQQHSRFSGAAWLCCIEAAATRERLAAARPRQ